MFDIKFYEDSAGREPIVEYIDDLRAKSAKIKTDRIKYKALMRYLTILSEHGVLAGEPYVKHIVDDIWELRPIDDRIFFFYWKDETYVMLHHIVKTGQKLPQREIDQAKRNKQDFLERNSN